MNSNGRKKLAQAVVARRVELGMRTTKALALEAGLSARMLGDVENGRRDNFSDGAKAQIELALSWDPGSIDAVLAGGEASVSGLIRDRTGRPISRWTAIEGSEQEELELFRLAYLVMDTRDLVQSQTGPLRTAVTALLDEAAELTMRKVARWRSGHDDIGVKEITDAQWFIDVTRNSNNIRRQGHVYLADRDPNPVTRMRRPRSIDQSASRAHGQLTSVTTVGDYTVDVPAHVAYVDIVLLGGGGGGGGYNGVACSAGGSGGDTTATVGSSIFTATGGAGGVGSTISAASPGGSPGPHTFGGRTYDGGDGGAVGCSGAGEDGVAPGGGGGGGSNGGCGGAGGDAGGWFVEKVAISSGVTKISGRVGAGGVGGDATNAAAGGTGAEGAAFFYFYP